MPKIKLTRRQRDERRAVRHQARIDAMFPDEPPRDVDAFRFMLARKIGMFIGARKQYWRGCKEPACRRMRACVAPRIRCSNAPPLPPDPNGRRGARAMAQVSSALRDLPPRPEEK